jgi:hypothetical protein
MNFSHPLEIDFEDLSEEKNLYIEFSSLNLYNARESGDNIQFMAFMQRAQIYDMAC